MTGDLLRAPLLAKELGDQAAGLGGGVHPAATLACMSGGSAAMSIEGPVPAADIALRRSPQAQPAD